MKNLGIVLAFLATFMLANNSLMAQQLTQTIRGTVLDKDAQMPLIGANVTVLSTDPIMGTTTDVDGYFKLENVPVGRQNIEISYLGYEPQLLNSIMLTSGKELVLKLELVESTIAMDEVVVVAKHDKNKTLNELATVSARSFSVEETARYASSFYDPARMAQNYAGVSAGAGEDLFNEIIIRGNSPKGVLWRLEGIEVPNPNHFAAAGSSGGAISMLSSSTLSNSDFYTGAFPSEFGNAMSGVFDLNMRNGNNEKREYAFMLGALGLEAAMEGPFSPNSRASYLINYRYSTLAILEAVGLSPTGDVTPKYSDLSFKVNIPTQKAGTFALFGLGGKNSSTYEPEPDSTLWDHSDDKWGWVENQTVGTVGLSHRILLSDKSYLRTVVAASYENSESEDYYLDTEKDYTRHVDDQYNITDKSIRASTTYNHKFNARNTLRAGLIFSYLDFNFTYDEDSGEGLVRYFDNEGSSNFLQGFAHWKHRFNDKWTANVGLHYSRLGLNGSDAIEPRAAVQWRFSPKQSISASVGLHSRKEHLAAYLFEGSFADGTIHTPATHLELTKAMHAVLAYDHQFSKNLRLKTELYYQHLYDVPVLTDPKYRGSMINTFNIWDIVGNEGVSNEGTGRNYGIDLTLERFFANNYYFLVTGSLYESKYTPIDGIEYNTRFNGNYQLNLLGGKEIKMGKKKKNILGINAKFILAGGNRYTPVDVEASQETGEAVYLYDQAFGERAGTYYRFDLGLSYKINKSKLTHTIMLDIQNITNRLNVFAKYFDEDTNQVETYYQNGFFPVFNYRIEF
jgi:hypothetical protein